MTIEEKFFKAFGIEPKKTQQIVGNGVSSNVIEEEYYPEITAEILLKLICIIVSQMTSYAVNNSNIYKLKENVLNKTISLSSYIKEDVHKLFREKKNWQTEVSF